MTTKTVNLTSIENESLEHAFLNQIETDLNDKDFDAFSEMFYVLLGTCTQAKDVIYQYLSDTAQENLKEGLTFKRY